MQQDGVETSEAHFAKLKLIQLNRTQGGPHERRLKDSPELVLVLTLNPIVQGPI